MELVEQLKEEALQRGSKRIDFDDPSLLSDRDYLTVIYDEKKIDLLNRAIQYNPN